MIIAAIGLIAFVGMANIWYYEHKVIRPRPRVLNFIGYKFKEK